ncbi:MAG: hypothetical protein ABIJ47_07835 [Candidatus Bathyarchaeota archaeon]
MTGTLNKKRIKHEMLQAAQTMDKLAEKTDPAWSGSDEVQRWRRQHKQADKAFH